MTSLLRNSTLLRLTELLLTHVSVVFVEFKLRVRRFRIRSAEVKKHSFEKIDVKVWTIRA